MNTRGKQLAVGFLALGALAVWTPRVLQALREGGDPPAEEDLPAWIGDEHARIEELEPSELGAQPSSPVGEAVRRAPSGAAVEDLRNILSERARRRGERAWEEPAGLPTTTTPAPGTAEQEVDSAAESAREPDPDSELGRFLSEHPWNAVLGGSDDARAIFGALCLRIGERLPGTSARIEQIAAEGVVLAEGERRWRLERLAAARASTITANRPSEVTPGAPDAPAGAFDPEPPR